MGAVAWTMPTREELDALNARWRAHAAAARLDATADALLAAGAALRWDDNVFDGPEQYFCHDPSFQAWWRGRLLAESRMGEGEAASVIGVLERAPGMLEAWRARDGDEAGRDDGRDDGNRADPDRPDRR